MTMVDAFRIGDAAAVLGIEAHVLRHWEAMGLLAPPRTPSGHRHYDEQTLDRARLIRVLQRTGLSLEQIRSLGGGAHSERLALIADQRAELRERIEVLRAADRFLDHLTACRNPVIAECAECAQFVALSPWPHRPPPRD
ncbi:MerR family transcriptional regulator [Nocardia crassostreae]|uniref:MerR family transcriptional regulator n=1 Tax=Nocardia crassostreae TaxID=53428 RepID=UPI0009FD6A88|nr:MerR family transcriptional regulator [Nocardia crassostreae]